jgi:hypothetical protein
MANRAVLTLEVPAGRHRTPIEASWTGGKMRPVLQSAERSR